MPIDFAKGIATQALNNGLRKVAGNLPGLLGKIRGKQGARESSETTDLDNAKTPGVSPKLIQFPLDIDSDPGRVIMDTILFSTSTNLQRHN